jgi:hypothetical protein
MSDQQIPTHWDECWKDPKHHACAVRRIEWLKNTHLAVKSTLLEEYENICKRYGHPSLGVTGRVQWTNGAMAEAELVLVLLGALDALPPPWKLEADDE